MKTFRNLKEETKEAVTPEEIVENCSEFIQIMGEDHIEEYILYRGINSPIDIEKPIRKSIRKNRKPRDTPQIIHELFSEYFEYNFNINPRGNGLPVTGSHKEAADYGNGSVFAVIPENGWNVVWSPHIEDLTMDAGDFISDRYNIPFQSLKKIKNNDELEQIIGTDFSNFKEDLYKFLDRANFQEGKENIKKAISSRNEIFLLGKSYILIDDYKYPRIISEVLNIARERNLIT